MWDGVSYPATIRGYLRDARECGECDGAESARKGYGNACDSSGQRVALRLGIRGDVWEKHVKWPDATKLCDAYYFAFKEAYRKTRNR